jgi:mono/diheme cytochrome c family protein
MNHPVRFLFALLSVSACQPAPVRAADSTPGGPRDWAAEVRAVFAAKCAGCHGPQLAKPRGRFGYVLDLARVANSREMVVPGRPSESELWELVRRGEMPPPDAPTGFLTASQKEVIQAWIAAGAPAQSLSPPLELPAGIPSSDDLRTEPATVPPVEHFLRWIGKFHLLLLHFPIAFLLAAGVGECWSLVGNSRSVEPAVRFAILLGASFAVITAALGWLHALSGYGVGTPRILTLHRWLGTAACLGAVVAAFLSERDARRGDRSMLMRVVLFTGGLLIGLTGHFGGILAHGEDFFDW